MMDEKAEMDSCNANSEHCASMVLDDRLARTRVVLINTTHPGNIGATARAMKVMGLKQLHLVSPKIFPSAEATARASGADDILQHAHVHESLDAALSGCGLVLGTSARLRSLPMPMLDAQAAARQAIAEVEEHEVALLFGRERHGLTNEEMQRCNFLVNIPTNPEYGSLNISQAVQIMAYELRISAMLASGGEVGVALPPADWKPVDGAQMDLLFEHLEQTLLDLKFLNPDQPKKLMIASAPPVQPGTAGSERDEHTSGHPAGCPGRLRGIVSAGCWSGLWPRPSDTHSGSLSRGRMDPPAIRLPRAVRGARERSSAATNPAVPYIHMQERWPGRQSGFIADNQVLLFPLPDQVHLVAHLRLAKWG